MLTARGVPGGTAANTFDEAYLDELSNTAIKEKKLEKKIESIYICRTTGWLASQTRHKFTNHLTVNVIAMIVPPELVIVLDQNQRHFVQYY